MIEHGVSTQTIELAAEAIRGHNSAHSLATGPVIAEPAIQHMTVSKFWRFDGYYWPSISCQIVFIVLQTADYRCTHVMTRADGLHTLNICAYWLQRLSLPNKTTQGVQQPHLHLSDGETSHMKPDMTTCRIHRQYAASID